MRAATLLLGLVAFTACAPPAEADPESLTGRWLVDYERTLEAAPDHPDYDPSEAERLPAMVERMAQSMEIVVGPATLTYRRGRGEQALPLVFDSVSGDDVFATATPPEGEPVTVAFTLLDDDRMRFETSGGGDMSAFVWRRAGDDAAEPIGAAGIGAELAEEMSDSAARPR